MEDPKRNADLDENPRKFNFKHMNSWFYDWISIFRLLFLGK